MTYQDQEALFDGYCPKCGAKVQTDATGPGFPGEYLGRGSCTDQDCTFKFGWFEGPEGECQMWEVSNGQ